MERVINGKMNKKLLQKTLRYYFIYALAILVTVGPIFYIASNILYEDDANEDLYAIKKQFDAFTKEELTINDIPVWNKFNRDVNLQKWNGKTKDSLFDHSYYDASNKENEPFRVLNSPVKIENKWFTFSAKINMVEKENLIFSTVILFIILLVLLIIGFLIITKIISEKLWQPFYAALNKIEQFEIDKTNKTELINSSTEEFERLNKAIENLIQKNRVIYKSQREFIENAAHELQTPLAVFKGKLENILQRNDLNEEQFKALDDLTTTSSRLAKLNRNLLVLSKIENNTFNEIEKNDFSILINNQISFFEQQASSKKIIINTNIEKNVLIDCNATLAEMLINNLFINTINHNIPNGKVFLNLNKEKLIFSNTGLNIPLQKEKMYNRFSKINPNSQGNGLGLSIIKKIIETNNWEINYKFKNRHHIFEIIF